jgi:hypothetical protein
MYKYLLGFFFIYIFNTYPFHAYKLNNTPLFSNNLHKLLFKANDMLDILTSIKEYTIITDNENDKHLYDILNGLHKNVYFINLNNLLDKDNILSYLKERYNNIDTGENLWIFYRGFMLGSRESINQIIKKNNNTMNLSKRNVDKELLSRELYSKDYTL